MAVISSFGTSCNQRTGAAANSCFSNEAHSQAVIANIRLDAVHPIPDVVKMGTK